MLGGRIKVSDVYHQPALYSVSNDNPVQLYTNTEFNAFDAHATQTLDRSKTVLTFRDDANDYKPTVVELDGSGVQLDSTAFDYDIDFNQAVLYLTTIPPPLWLVKTLYKISSLLIAAWLKSIS